MNFWAGMDGQVYVRGNIYATDGVFNGTVYAKDGEFSGAIKAATLDGKLVGSANASVDLSDVDYIDLGGMILDGRPGSTGIRFKPGYEPVKYQFAQAQSGPWHDAMQTNDKYRRDSLDGGTHWGTAYQFRGTDGQDGSDANVTRANIEKALRYASSLGSTCIAVDSVGAPAIYGGKIYGTDIYAGDGSGSYAHMGGDGLDIYCGGVSNPKIKLDIGYSGNQPRIDLGSGDNTGRQIFSIYKNSTQGVIQYSGYGTNYCMLLFNEDGGIMPLGPTHMTGTWDFSGASVKGVYATFA